MSFLLVAGKIFVCQKCQKLITIEYEGGALLTQIGDENVMQQSEYSQHMKQPNSNPDEQGHFLYDIGLCTSCYHVQNSRSDQLKNEEIFEITNSITTSNEEAKAAILEVLPGLLKGIASEMTIDDVSSAVNGSIDP